MRQCSLDLSALSVLVIDDSDHMRSILKSILLAFRIRRVFEARDGADGLYMATAWRPDIILCDWLMRPLNGGEFITILRSDQDPAIAATPAVLVSAYTSKAVILKAIQLGFHEVLAKPVAPVALYQRLERLVRDDRPFSGRAPDCGFRPGARQGSATGRRSVLGGGTKR